jgi:hypothetical protein
MLSRLPRVCTCFITNSLPLLGPGLGITTSSMVKSMKPLGGGVVCCCDGCSVDGFVCGSILLDDC